jgi:hypothetical protein
MIITLARARWRRLPLQRQLNVLFEARKAAHRVITARLLLFPLVEART